ncbi:transmembrane protein, putative (macronuclear) [Tetrahymena thermophila SB210]|uniref:Transmembrane protein, putative n=1 Tax=Tetrahymena thermophila (strain SB210) TaxID=312017 RepID=Q234V8_TETTS|nr:transmembrane protein, putative [Tetrahymena thermophila SB210]EAR91895.3 transmembrane protein, putative [Tetrahymena thermophila SB210]|eukprot:XP_001012140.3 transmembrane protein, putative [Tetrahymena thermophila SB210]
MVIIFKIVHALHVILHVRPVMVNLAKIVYLVKTHSIFIKIKHVKVLVKPKMAIILNGTNVYLVILLVRHVMVNLAKIVQHANPPFFFFKIGKNKQMCLKLFLIEIFIKSYKNQQMLNTCSTTCDTQNGYYIQGSKCLNTCDTQNGFFIQGNLCLQCDSGCQTCNEYQNCLSCKPSFYLYQNNTCLSYCDTQNGYYQSENSCLACDSTCQICDGDSKSNCITCKQQLYLYQDKTCLSHCETQNGYYLQENQCLRCDSSCQTCYGSSNQNCLSCQQPLYLQSDNTCRICDTKNGYYISEGKCLQCNNSCLTCNGGSSKDCLSCQSGKFLDIIKIQKNEAGSCFSCDQSCLKCQGPSNKDCITCLKSYILLPTLGKCALCEEGYFFNQSSCDQCDQTCLTCTGKNKQDCIDCRPGLTFSNISKTCQESSQVQYEQNQLKLNQEIGCYDQKQQQVVSTCLDQFQNSQSNTKILDTLFIVNLSLIVTSSIFTPLGSSLGWIFIQNQQLLGNYIFAYKLVPLWMNQLEMKSSYAHHFFTMISNINIVKTYNEAKLFEFKQFNTLFTINDFWNSFLNNCFVALIVFGLCLGNLIIFFCLNLRQIQDQNNSRKKDFGMSDLIGILVFSIFYLIMQLYWNTIIGCKYQSIPYKDITSFNNLVQNIEISYTSQRIFWLLFEWKKSLYILQQLYFLESSLLKKVRQIRTIFQNQIQICEMVWNYFKMIRKTNSINKNQTTTGNLNMVEQMTDSNIEKLFEMLNQSKKKNQLNQ